METEQLSMTKKTLVGVQFLFRLSVLRFWCLF